MRRMLSIGLIVFLLIFITALTKNILDSYKRLEDLGKVKKEEQALEKETKELKKELEYRDSEEFVEKEARNKLGLSKKGESIYVVEDESSEEENSISGEKEDFSNWQLWVKVFTK